MLSYPLDRSPRLALLFAATFAVGTMLMTTDLVGQYDSTRPTNPETNHRNGLRTDTNSYRVPERVSLRQDETVQEQEPTDSRDRRRRGPQQPVQGTARRAPSRAIQDSQVRTQGSVPVRTRRPNIRRTNYQSPYTPKHARVANAGQPPILGGNAPMRSTVAGRLVGQVEDEIYYDAEVGTPVEEFIDGDCCGNCAGCCDACDVGSPCIGGFCDRVNTDVCGCGDLRNCPICQACWLNGFGGLICNTEFFLGTHAFDPLNLGPRQTAGMQTGHYGFHGGVNVGLTLKRLTCGLVSGQIGASVYSSDFGGDGVFINETREQVFVTAGFFRRVDYGFQFGAVADLLHEDWFYQTDMVQIRSEISYAYGDGSLLGFRFALNVQDGGTGHAFGVMPTTLDTYRFFGRMPAFNGQGFGEVFAGFSGQSHAVIGGSADVNLTRLLAIQTGYTYVWRNENVDEASNVYVRMVLRPASRNWFRNYHRPFMPVADNGSMITVWQ